MKDEKEPWIPVGERLPEEKWEGEALTKLGGFCKPARRWANQWQIGAPDNKGWNYVEDTFFTHWREIAKPEPAITEHTVVNPDGSSTQVYSDTAKAVSPAEAMKRVPWTTHNATWKEIWQAGLHAFLTPKVDTVAP